MKKLSVRTGSTGQPQLSHLTAEHQQPVNDTVRKMEAFERNYPASPNKALTFNDICIKERLSKVFYVWMRETAERLLMRRSNTPDTAGG